jgi:hypothetical protein
VQGSLHTREAEIQNKLNKAFDAGNIDSNELASFQRDLDGILVKEDREKTKASGLTNSGFARISKDLDIFEGRLARHSTKLGAVTKADPTNTRQAAINVNNKNAEPVLVPVGPQITGNQSSIVQPTKKVLLVPTTDTVVVPSDTIVTPASPSSVAMPADAIVLPK